MLELNQARNIFGGFTIECRKRIEAFYENPSFETWEQCRNIIIGGQQWTTVRQAVIGVDPTFIRHSLKDAERIPDKATFERAIRWGSR